MTPERRTHIRATHDAQRCFVAGGDGGGYLLVLAIALPVLGILLAVALGGRHAERVAAVFLPAGLVVAAAILAELWRSGEPLLYVVGGWTPPLGIALRADGCR